jgi:cytidine deaminase
MAKANTYLISSDCTVSSMLAVKQRFFIGLLLMLSLLVWFPHSSLSATAPPKAPTRVVYGFDREFPPFTFEEAGGEPTGFEVDLMKSIFAETDANLVFRPLQWDLIPLELSSGTIVLTSGMVRTEQRSRLYLFSGKPTFSLQIRLFTKVYNRFPSATLLRGQPVSVEQGTYQHRLLDEFGGINIKLYKGRVDGLRALYNDEVAAFCGALQNTYYYIKKLNYGAITTMGTPLGITEMRIAVNRERGDILKMVDQGLARVMANGEYDRLYRKWFVRELSDQERTVMLSSAVNAAIPAYVPYGSKGQGAAVLTATGKVYTACTVENADLSLTISALSGAVSNAVSNGEFELRSAVVVTPEGDVVMPSPDELQLLYEFGRGILVLQEPSKGNYSVSMLAEILPNPIVKDTPTIQVE